MRVLLQSSTLNTCPRAELRGEGQYLIGPERRCGISDMELAAIMLSHAISYLVENQRAHRHPSLQASREAIQFLCQGAKEIHRSERRAPARHSIEAWLSKIEIRRH